MSGTVLPIGDGMPPPQLASVHMVRLRPSPPKKKRGAWFWSPAVFLLAAGATFVVPYLRTTSVTASAPRISLPDPRSASLDMRIETQGAGLRLSWNRYSPAVQVASSGTLEINDGGRHREIALDRNQVLDGSIVYRPASDDVSFRLNVHRDDGGDVMQVLRLLDASPRLPPIEATVAHEPAATHVLTEPIQRAHRATQTHTPPVASVNQFAGQKVARAEPALNPERKAPPVVQVASAAGSNASPSRPLADAKIAAPKPAEPQLQKAAAVAHPIQPPAASSQPKLDAASNAGTAAVKSAAVAAFVPPRPLKWVQPDARLLGASRPAAPVDIKVKVKIDETGHVTAAHVLMDGGKPGKKLMTAAAAVVREWVFEPAKSHGVNVPSEEIIVIHLGPEAQ